MLNIGRAAEDGRLVIFAGAGISMLPPSNLPSWRDVNRIVVDALAGKASAIIGEDRASEAAELILTRHQHEKLPPEFQAQVLADLLGVHYFKVLRHLDSDRPNPAHLTIAWLARLGCVRAVITTNFDRLLETAFEAAGAPVERHFSEAHFQSLAGDLDRFGHPGGPCQLLKLHGSVDDPETLIDTLAQRKRGFPPAVTQCVRHLLHLGPWLFLGFSGLDLEAEPTYLSLAPESDTAVGFTWLVRQGTPPRPAVARLKELYGDRGEIVLGDLPGWILDLAAGLSSEVRPWIEQHLANADPAAGGDSAELLRYNVDEWAGGLTPHICSMALAHLTVACAEPQLSADLLEALIRAVDQPAAPDEQIQRRFSLVKAMTMNSLGCTLAALGRHEEAVRWLGGAIDLMGLPDDQDIRDRFATNLAWSLETLGRVEEARKLYESSLAGFRSRGDPRTIASGLNNLAAHLIRQGKLTQAWSLSEEAVQYAKLAGDEPPRIVALNNLGMISQLQERHNAALEYFTECEQVCRRLGNDDGVAAALGNLGDTLSSLDRAEEAEPLYRSALEIMGRLKRHDNRGTVLMSVAFGARQRGDHAEAARYYAEALDIFRAIKDPAQEAMALYRLATIKAESGALEEALRLDLEALPLATGRNKWCEAQILAHIGLASLKLGRSGQAEQAYRKSYATAVELEDLRLAAISAQNLGLTLLLRGRSAEAAHTYAEAAALWSRLKNDTEFAHCKLGQAAVLLDETIGCLSDAGHAFDDAAERSSAAGRMAVLYPVLIDMYGGLGAVEQAARFAMSAGSTWQFLSDLPRAIACYREAAEQYQSLEMEERRSEALAGAEKLLKRHANAMVNEGSLEQAVASQRALAEVAAALGHREVYGLALLNVAISLYKSGTGLAEARETARLAALELDPASDGARTALAVIQACDARLG